MSGQTTRRMFLQKVVVGIGAAAAAASGFSPLVSSRGDLLNQLAQHLFKIGYNVCRYSKW